MKATKYSSLRNNPIKIEVVENPRKMLIDMVSSMSDRRAQLSIKRKDNGEYVLDTGNDAYSNFQLKATKADIEWEAEDGNWEKVFELLRSGKWEIENVKSK